MKPRWYLLISPAYPPNSPHPLAQYLPSPFTEVSPQGLAALSRPSLRHQLPCPSSSFLFPEGLPQHPTCPAGLTLKENKPNFPDYRDPSSYGLLSPSLSTDKLLRGIVYTGPATHLLFFSPLVPLLSSFSLYLYPGF